MPKILQSTVISCSVCPFSFKDYREDSDPAWKESQYCKLTGSDVSIYTDNIATDCPLDDAPEEEE